MEEWFSCTHNMEDNHYYHDYVNYQPYTASLHRIYCVCGHYTSGAHNFVASGNVLVCSDCNYRKTTGGPVIEPWGYREFGEE